MSRTVRDGAAGTAGGSAGAGMLPLADLDASKCSRVRAVFTDLDDTLTLRGKLTAPAYEAMWRIRDAGLHLVVVTGRPAGWADLMMRLWPVAAVVGENGACIYRLDPAGRAIRWYADDEPARRRNRSLLDGAGRELLALVPGARLASDQPFRETDLAIDTSEEVAAVDEATTTRIGELLSARGLRYKVSSIHINAWVGDYDKASTCRRLIPELLDGATAPRAIGDQCLFVGDSPNDEPLFEAFGLSVGVRNIERFASSMLHPPAFVTPSEGADGFAELAAHLLRGRVQP